MHNKTQKLAVTPNSLPGQAGVGGQHPRGRDDGGGAGVGAGEGAVARAPTLQEGQGGPLRLLAPLTPLALAPRAAGWGEGRVRAGEGGEGVVRVRG